MGRYRAIMTETDREYISHPDMSEENKRYQSISRIRSRIEELDKDVRLLEEHHPELLAEVREAVGCEDA